MLTPNHCQAPQESSSAGWVSRSTASEANHWGGHTHASVNFRDAFMPRIRRRLAVNSDATRTWRTSRPTGAWSLILGSIFGGDHVSQNDTKFDLLACLTRQPKWTWREVLSA